jgi:hypothetical protein
VKVDSPRSSPSDPRRPAHQRPSDGLDVFEIGTVTPTFWRFRPDGRKLELVGCDIENHSRPLSRRWRNQ